MWVHTSDVSGHGRAVNSVQVWGGDGVGGTPQRLLCPGGNGVVSVK